MSVKNIKDVRQAISTLDAIIDSRDVIDRIEELEAIIAADASDDDDRQEAGVELLILNKLAAEGKQSSDDWDYGATLIRDSYFKTYAMDLADDLNMIPDRATWPCTCIDWDGAARELQQDFTSVDFNGVTYWVRSPTTQG